MKDWAFRDIAGIDDLDKRVGCLGVLLAWEVGELSEGQAAKALDVDRLTLRGLRLEGIAAGVEWQQHRAERVGGGDGMGLAYVRRRYGVPAKRGGRVRRQWDQREGVITSATHYIYVRLDGERHSRPHHPMDLLYLDEQQGRE